MDEYLGSYEVKSANVSTKFETENLTADTRTFLYFEVLNSAILHNYLIWGRTNARGNDSEYFGEYNKYELQTRKGERFSNEASILNIFTWLGSIGVVLYFLVFLKATNLAINNSNNIYIKIVGLYISFRWFYSWIEEFSEFDLSNFFLWLMIGMCFSEHFRRMNDKQMSIWVKGIFDNKLALKNS
jgi:hypothetical protein